ncbi:MAG TPA: LysM peptidoglycan-binding domain-containing protein [Desulfosporosinus sp.]
MNYIVKKGDALYKIAKKFNVTIQAILDANPQIHDPNVLFIGQQITIPASGGGKAPNGGSGVAESGTSGQKPLHIVTATLLSGTHLQGSTNISINPDMVLTFNKNVVNNTVWANNQSSINLTTNAGRNVPISVTKISDKIDFTQRQKIYLRPIHPLTPGTEYILRLFPGLKSFNGHTLGETTGGQSVTVRFKTH